jgi:histidinol dehydrogenase
VSQVFLQVQKEGDKAVAAYTQQFDKIDLISTAVTESEISHAISRVSDELKKSIQLAKSQYRSFS